MVATPALFVLLVGMIPVVMGLVLEAPPMVLILTPVLLPRALGMGFGTIWFGVFMVIMAETALITPPVDLSLQVIQSVARVKLDDVARGALPFLLLMFL